MMGDVEGNVNWLAGGEWVLGQTEYSQVVIVLVKDDATRGSHTARIGFVGV